MTDIKHLTNKVGIVPYRWRTVDGGACEMEFLIHLPKHDPAKGGNPDTMSWGIARGTVQYRNEAQQWVDLRSNGKEMRDEALQAIPLGHIKNHIDCVVEEAKEELGLSRGDLQAKGPLHDHRLKTYPSGKGSYDIHFYSAELSPELDIATLTPQHSDALAWKTLAELRQMTQEADPSKQFKAGYVPIVEDIAREVEQHKAQQLSVG